MPELARWASPCCGCHISNGLDQPPFSCSGFSGQGIAMATLAGRVAAEAFHAQASHFDVICGLPTPNFPGEPSLRAPLLAAAMTWFTLRDKL